MPPVVLVLMDVLYPELVAGIAEVSRQAGWALSINQLRTPLVLPPRAADGCLLVCIGSTLRDWATARPEPKVAMICPVPDRPWPCVKTDWEEAGRMGAEHLLSLGDRQLAFLRYGDTADTLALQKGFFAACRKNGREPVFLWPGMNESSPALPIMGVGQRLDVLVRRIAGMQGPMAVLAEDDRFAVEVISAAGLAGRHVPDDVAVLGCENLHIFQMLSQIPVSSVDLGLTEIGRRAAEMLDLMMKRPGRPNPPDLVVPPLGVVSRSSTASFDCADPGISAAVRHVRSHFSEPLTIDKLSELAGMSVGKLRREFKRHVGRAVHEEINRCRLAHAESLLRRPDLKISTIAVDSGFKQPLQLWRLFKDVHGCGPNEWRHRLGIFSG